MTALKRIPQFRPLAVAFVLGEAIEWFALVALAFVVFDETRDALATTALFVSSRLVPSLLVPIATGRLERWANSRGIGIVMAVEAAVFCALAVSLSSFSLVLVCALALVDGFLASLVRALTRAAVAHTLEPADAIREGNAVLNIGFAVMNVAGPGLAGVVLAVTSAQATLVAGATLLVLTSLYLVAHGERPDVPHAASGLGTRLGDLVRYLRANRKVAALIGGESIVLMFGTLIAPIEIVLATESLGAGKEGYPALAASWGAGLTTGSLVYARYGQRRLKVSLLVSTLVMGVGIVAMGLAPTLVAACVAATVAGAGNGVQWVSAVTAVQESVRADMQLRVAGLLEGALTFVPGVGYLLGGVLAETLSPRLAFVVAGGGIITCAAAAMIALGRRPPAAPA